MWNKNDGTCPVRRGVKIDIMFLDGLEITIDDADVWLWFDAGSSTITHWRFHNSKVEDVVSGTNTEGEAPLGINSTGINPKQALGQASLPLNLFSPLATAYGCIGKLNGSLKYGTSNFVATPVIASIYCDAIRRHLDKWMSGQENDSADGVPHFAAMLANIDILLCARAAGTLVDDRPLLIGFEAEMEKLTPIVKALQELHKDKSPHHYLLSKADAV